MILDLLGRVREEGAKQAEACRIVGINETTVQDWRGVPRRRDAGHLEGV
jgi:hypothetical protein